MTYYMNLHARPFAMIASGKKTIELRLLDEKRKRIRVGDTLVFKNVQEEAAILSCVVKKLYIFSDFEELYRSLPLEKCGYTQEELATASAKDMEAYYSIEEQKNYGVVGIEIQCI